MTETIEMDEILQEFLAESGEALDRVERDLLLLEKKPGDREILGEIFRAAHTIKGTCGFLELERLGSVAHAGESLLSHLRDGELDMDLDIANALFALVDAIREMLAAVAATGDDGNKDYAGLIALLTRLRNGSQAKAAAASKAAKTAQTAAKSVSARIETKPAGARTAAEQAAGAAADVFPAVENPGSPPGGHAHEEETMTRALEPVRIGDLLIAEYGVDAGEVAEAVDAQQFGDPRHLGEILVENGAVKPETVREALGRQRQYAGPGRSAADSTVRVDVQLLDKLMNLVGELVLVRNRVQQLAEGREDPNWGRAVQTLNLVTAELQQEAMKTRMQPVNNVWGKLPRLVRDLAHASGKKIRVVMEGEETELDRSLVEAIRDPLTHIIRNSIDHGIEEPGQRVSKGKPEEGLLSLTARHAGGRVVIEIRDDGAGIDIERVRARAVAQGLVGGDDAVRMGTRELSSLLFAPGFSTAEKVTSISGRGVGMDVVKTNVEKVGGTVEIDSEPGAGTLVRIQLPLTLAIVPAVTVICAGRVFAIPQVGVAELIRTDQGGSAIEHLHAAPVYRLRGKLLPLADMNVVLGLEETGGADAQRRPIVVIRNEHGNFGLLVDEVVGTQEILVKPLSKLLNGMAEFAGCTIMGDGRVALIVDVFGLARRAGLVATAGGPRMADIHDEQSDDSGGQFERERWLVVKTLGDGRVAIPLADVVRLEHIPREQIENTAGRMMVQYRGGILPVHDLADLLDECAARPRTEPPSGHGCAPIVVYAADGRLVGLLVERIVDVVAENVELTGPATRKGIHGTAVLNGRVTELIDTDYLNKTMGC